MVLSEEYHKSRAVGVMSNVGLTTDQCPFRAVSLSASVSPVLKRLGVFYTSAIPEVSWYEPLYNGMIYYHT